MIWMLFVFTVPMFLAYTMQLALSKGALTLEGPVGSACTFTAVATVATDVSLYEMDNGECSNAIHASLSAPVRSPELALIVSKNAIALDNLSGAGVKYFNGQKHLSIELAVPTSSSYEVVLADMLRQEVIDRAKLVVK